MPDNGTHTDTPKPTRTKRTTEERLAALQRRSDALAEQTAKLKKAEAKKASRLAAKENGAKRKIENRLKVLAGVSEFAELDFLIKKDPAAAGKKRAAMVAQFARTITNPNDIAFLSEQGWLS